MVAKTFKYVMIPPEGEMMELEFESCESLENDRFIDHLKKFFSTKGGGIDQDLLLKTMSVHAKKDLMSEINDDMKNQIMEVCSLDIFPVAVPTELTEFKAVSLYVDDKGVAKELPFNPRVTGLVEACGYPAQAFRGHAFLSRVFDNDDDWRRIDFTLNDVSSRSNWVQASLKLRKETGGAGLRGLSDIASSGLSANGPADPKYAEAMRKAQELPSGHTDSYKWTQTQDEIEVSLSTLALTRKDVQVVMNHNSLKVLVKGDVCIDGKLFGPIENDCSTWTLSDGQLTISMEKREGKSWKALLA